MLRSLVNTRTLRDKHLQREVEQIDFDLSGPLWTPFSRPRELSRVVAAVRRLRDR